MGNHGPIDSAEAMIAEIKRLGLVPFVNCGIDGWSIQELTAPGCWFTEDGVLGPWDWKIDCVRTGEIAYGKFLGGKAAFMTVEFYRELMNYRRSLPKYRMAISEKYKVTTTSEKLMKLLSPMVLETIREAGSIGCKEIKTSLAGKLSEKQIKPLGAKYKPLLMSSIKKNILDSVIGFLQMGGWCVVGDYERLYKGPNLEYVGWQHAVYTTPEALYPEDTIEDDASSIPSWAKRFESDTKKENSRPVRTPEESRDYMIEHVLKMYPDAPIDKLRKLF